MHKRTLYILRCNRIGFTIIELLVVVAILSLLISILLPSLTRAKHLAKTALCMAQQRNLSGGFYYYAADNSGFFPLAYRTLKPPQYAPCAEEDLMWWSLLIKFAAIPDSRMVYCPESVFKPVASGGNPRVPDGKKEDRPATAADIWPNGAVHGGVWQGSIGMRTWSSAPFRPERVTNTPSEAQLLLDSLYRGGINWKTAADVISRQRTPWSDKGAGYWFDAMSQVTKDSSVHVSLRHDYRSNCTYMDGHVENISGVKAWKY